MKPLILVALVVLGSAPPLQAADVLAPAPERFKTATSEERPSFQRHVLPLLGRLGCNGRACHGSFQGQGGFRLSLFGYDFKADHDALTGGDAPRVQLKAPADSLLFQKATQTVSHKGGQRFAVDSWQHHLLRRWVQSGAGGVKDGDAAFVALDVQPREIVFSRSGETVALKVIARWSDGTREDVTPLCRFQSNNSAAAEVDAAGVVTCRGKGDTDIVAFYDNGVGTVPALLPVSDRVGPRYPDIPTPTRIDELVTARLRKLGIVPAQPCGDADFLRRVSLDLTGTLPAAAEVEAFLAERSADKRRRKVDELLERPAYAAWWATKLCDVTGNSERTGPLGGEQGLNRDKAKQWYAWIQRRVRENVPYDKLVEGIVLAVGRPAEQSYEDYCAEMSGYFRAAKPADFSARATMPYFWTRRNVGAAEGKALSFAYSFLGVSLQCAQCHKHPYDQWTKQDFDQFTAFFEGVRYGGAQKEVVQKMKKEAGLALDLDEDSGQYKRQFAALLAQGKLMPFKELRIPIPTANKGKPVRPTSRLGRVITPKLLGGEEVIARDYADPRQPLMDWLRQEDNPYFSRAFVNRVWGSCFNVALIDPPDDQNLANPPSNRELLDYLTHSFVKSGYDMKGLLRLIVTSRTYQLDWRPNETNRLDERNYSRSVLRRLPAEVIHDALALATASDAARKRLDDDPVGTRSIGVASCAPTRRGEDSYAVNLFGKPARLLNCDCERSSEPSLLQTVYLRNDREVLELIDRPDGWLRQVTLSKERDLEALVRQAYLRTLSRLPDDREKSVALGHLKEAGTVTAGLRDLLWALLNTKEFVVNR